MKDEIKEILELLNFTNDNTMWCDEIKLNVKQSHLLLDYITNLQEEVEDLREDNYAYHQLMKMQNKREYRSKFLKEFQEEFGTNIFPDYDEIYKRYDKLKKENENLKEQCKKDNHILGCNFAQKDKYKSRNENAIELCKSLIIFWKKYSPDNTIEIGQFENVLSTLNGEENGTNN